MPTSRRLPPPGSTFSQVDAILATFGVDLCSAAMPRLRLALDGFMRLERAIARKVKFRFTFRVLKRLARLVGSSRKERTLWAFCVAATQGLLRFGELTNATRPLTWGSSLRDLGPHALAVYLPDSKAALLRLGIEVILADHPRPLRCPAAPRQWDPRPPTPSSPSTEPLSENSW